MNGVNDTAFAGGAGASPEYDPIYDGFQEAKIPDAKETEESLPKGLYLVEFEGGKGSLAGDEKLPQIRLGATIIEGQEGTVGRKAFGNLKFATSKFGWQKNEQGVRMKFALSQEKWLEEGKEDQETLKRVATVLGLLQPLPNRPHTVESLTTHGSQFGGKRAVIEIGVMRGNDDFGPSNFFLWGSIRALDEVVKTKAGEVVGSALEYVRKKIAMAKSKADKAKGGKGGLPAATNAAPSASAADFQ